MSKEKVIQEQLEKIEGIKKAIKFAKSLPEFPEGEMSISSYSTFCNVHINIPYDWEIYKRCRRVLGNGWKGNGWTKTQFGNHIHLHQTFHKGGNYSQGVMISLATEMEGAVCKVEKIGEKTVSILEVVCN